MKKVRRQAAIFCIRFSGGQLLALFRRLCYIGSGGERTMKKLLGFFLAVFILVSPALAAGGNTVVYITRTGECYHTGSCRYLKKSKIEITLADAVARGYRACKVCCPPSLDGEERQGHAFAGSGQADSMPSPSPSASPTPTAAPTPAPDLAAKASGAGSGRFWAAGGAAATAGVYTLSGAVKRRFGRAAKK